MLIPQFPRNFNVDMAAKRNVVSTFGISTWVTSSEESGIIKGNPFLAFFYYDKTIHFLSQPLLIVPSDNWFIGVDL